MRIFILSTELGDFLLDDSLEQIENEDDMEVTMSITILDTALAPAEDWENWFQTMTMEEILEHIRPAITAHMSTLSDELNHLYGRKFT